MRCQVRACTHTASLVAEQLEIPVTSEGELTLELHVCHWHHEALTHAGEFVSRLAFEFNQPPEGLVVRVLEEVNHG